MSTTDLTIEEEFLWSEDTKLFCAGQAIIPAYKWTELTERLPELDEVTKTSAEILTIFEEQAKRFVACGANFGERFGVLRKNKKTGWKYLIDLVTAK
ncbi:hypothetical protein LCGC14_2772930 [marine sediment metagenome]|uniref:Uncharacterized protein n=1 Tax=marine sediment metagenome TaxID=412755 RepID=A0A0F8YVN2_9ZZZZ